MAETAIASPFTARPDEEDQPHYDPMASLLSGYGYGQQGPSSQVGVPPQQPATAAVAQSSPQQIAQPQANQPPAPAIALPPSPQAPPLDMDKYRSLEGEVSKYGQPINRKDP